MTIGLVVFDLGGTLVEDTGDVPQAFRAALESHGYTVSDTEIAGWRGASKREVLRRFIVERNVGRERTATTGTVDDLAARVYATFQSRLVDQFRRKPPRPLAGVAAALQELHGRGARVAVTTGFDRVVAEEVLACLENRATLHAVVCGDDVAAGRPAPDMIFRAMELTATPDASRVAAVGDTTNDLLAGAAAGVAVNVGVLTGAHDRERLLPAPHTHLLESAADVPRLLR